MFDAFSMRARQIVFAARFKAGERGAHLIEVEDFLFSLVLEDQGLLEQTVFSTLHGGQGTPVNKAPSHAPFFTPDVAQSLVTKINELAPQMEPIALATEIPLSPALVHVFGSANTFQGQFPYGPVEPLHLLAGILTDESNRCATLLKEFGITTERVKQQLGGIGGN